jgi:hypothetical protein
MGLGLFALQVLDRLKTRCAQQGLDWYDRLTWYATDATPAVLRDVQRSGIFDRHAGRVVFGQASAMQPAQIRTMAGEALDLTGDIQAVFHSYVFCMLPMSLLQVDGEAVSILLARTILRRPSLLAEYTSLSLEKIQAIVGRGDPTEHTALVDLYPLLDLELALSPVDPAGQDHVRQIAAAIRAEDPGEGPVWVLDSSGAEAALSATLDALRPDGFLLYRDYGPTTAAAANEQLIYQHYGATIAVQVNHFALERLLHAPAAITAPPGELPGKVSSRLAGRSALAQTRAAFCAAYNFADVLALRSAAGTARSAPDAALVASWQAALKIEPDNWLLLTEAADAIFNRLGDPGQAYPLLKHSLDLNPWIQATAWDLLAEMFLSANELGQAAAALEKSRSINPEHARLYAALSRLHQARGEHEAAVTAAAQAVAWESSPDRRIAHADRLQERISDLARRRAQDQRLRQERTAGGYHQRFSF